MKYIILFMVWLHMTSCSQEPNGRKYYLIRTFKNYEALSFTQWHYEEAKDSFYAKDNFSAYDTAMLHYHSRISTEQSLRTQYPNTLGLQNETTEVNVYTTDGENIKYHIPRPVRDSIEAFWTKLINAGPH